MEQVFGEFKRDTLASMSRELGLPEGNKAAMQKALLDHLQLKGIVCGKCYNLPPCCADLAPGLRPDKSQRA